MFQNINPGVLKAIQNIPAAAQNAQQTMQGVPDFLKQLQVQAQNFGSGKPIPSQQQFQPMPSLLGGNMSQRQQAPGQFNAQAQGQNQGFNPQMLQQMQQMKRAQQLAQLQQMMQGRNMEIPRPQAFFEPFQGMNEGM